MLDFTFIDPPCCTSDDLNDYVFVVSPKEECATWEGSQLFNVVRAAFAAACLLSLGALHNPADAQPQSSVATGSGAIFEGLLEHAPLAFEPNRGQVDPSVRFRARGPGYEVFLTKEEVAVVLANATTSKLDDRSAHPQGDARGTRQQAAVLRMRFVGANSAAAISGEDTLPHKTNYFLGADHSRHITDIESYAKVKYRSVYPGIDVVYHSSAGKLEYDLVIAPGASVAPIKINFPTAKKVSISHQGELVLSMPFGEMRYRKPFAYQDVDGRRVPIEAEYLVADGGRVSFHLGDYDTRKPLTIDPLLSYSSPLWGTYIKGLVRDSAGNAYVVGYTGGSDVPASNGYLTKLTGSQDAFVAKFSPSGTLLWATYLGGRKAFTYGYSVAVDANQNVYIGGSTNSALFPITTGAYETTWSGGSFITKLNPTGSALVYSTFVNGPYLTSIAVDTTGNAYLAAKGNGLVTTAGAFRTSPPSTESLSVAKLNAAGSAMVYATYIGGSHSADQARGLAVDREGNAYVTGYTRSADFPTVNALQSSLHGDRDVFVIKLNPLGSALVYSTYLGGGDYDSGNGITVDELGQAFVAGHTYSNDFPVTTGAFQPSSGYSPGGYSNGFIVKMSAFGSSLIYSSYIGGTCNDCSNSSAGDGATAVTVDAAGYAYVGGYVTSANFPQVDAIQPISSSGAGFYRTLYMAKVRPDGGGLVYSVAIGSRVSSGVEITGIGVDSAGGVFAAGYSNMASGFPITPGAQLTSTQANFIVKLEGAKYPTTVRSSVNPANASQPLTIAADVQSNVLGGFVTFYAGSIPIGTVSVTAGVASIFANLGPGIHRITAIYSADGKVSPPLFQLVNGR